MRPLRSMEPVFQAQSVAAFAEISLYVSQALLKWGEWSLAVDTHLFTHLSALTDLNLHSSEHERLLSLVSYEHDERSEEL